MNLSAEFELYSFSVRQFWPFFPFFPEFRVKSQTSYHFWLFIYLFFYKSEINVTKTSILRMLPSYLQLCCMFTVKPRRWSPFKLQHSLQLISGRFWLGNKNAGRPRSQKGDANVNRAKTCFARKSIHYSPTLFTETVVTNTNFQGCFDFAFIILYTICDSLAGCK